MTAPASRAPVGWLVPIAAVLALAGGCRSCHAEPVVHAGPDPDPKALPVRDFITASPDMWGSDGPAEWVEAGEWAMGRRPFVVACHGGTWSADWCLFPLARYGWPWDLIHLPVRDAVAFARALLPADRPLLLVVCNPDGLDLAPNPPPLVLMARGYVWVHPGSDWRPWGFIPFAVGSVAGFEEAQPSD